METEERLDRSGENVDRDRQDPTAGTVSTRRPYPWWQWLVAGIGGLLLLVTVGDLLYAGLVAVGGPPAVELTVVRVEPTPEHRYLAVIQATNTGGNTVAGLKIEGDLRERDGTSIEHGEFTLDYLPAGSSRTGGLFFSRDPHSRDVELKLHPSGYHEP
jgi:uncharacterized protein (TIGR02588 family)